MALRFFRSSLFPSSFHALCCFLQQYYTFVTFLQLNLSTFSFFFSIWFDPLVLIWRKVCVVNFCWLLMRLHKLYFVVRLFSAPSWGMFYMRSCRRRRRKNRTSHDEFVRCDGCDLRFVHTRRPFPHFFLRSCSCSPKLDKTKLMLRSKKATIWFNVYHVYHRVALMHSHCGVQFVSFSAHLGGHDQKTSTLKMNLWTSLARNQKENSFTLDPHANSLVLCI